jgi:hypothetical protein
LTELLRLNGVPREMTPIPQLRLVGE